MGIKFFYKNHMFEFFYKLFLSLKTVKNLYIFVFDYLHLLKKNYTLKMYGNKKMEIRYSTTDLQEAILVNSGHEYPIKLYKNILSDSSIVFNIGAHIGSFEVYLKKYFKNINIFSFEPNKENYNQLCKNVELNKLKNVFVNNVAVSDKTGKVYFADSDLNNDAYHISEKNQGTEIDSIDLDSFMAKNNLKTIDMIKMDCEGEEYKILNNFKNIKNIKALFLEYHKIDDVYNDKFIYEIMTKNNFKLVYRIDYRNFASGNMLFIKK